jgi:Arc/MetJ-type ribon-helix-helix transcriptional regulator
MTNLRNRTKVVYVRVSDEELQRFRNLRQQYGARNMSDLVRVAVEKMSQQRDTKFENEVTQKLGELENLMNHLKRTMGKVARGRQA